MNKPNTPSVLFVCVRNSGKSQMAAGLMRELVGKKVAVHSAGTEPGTNLNDLSVQALLDVGVDISGEAPKPIDPQLLSAVDLVVTLGREAHIESINGVAVENWDTDEPSERGIDPKAGTQPTLDHRHESGGQAARGTVMTKPTFLHDPPRFIFFTGKAGVGKTSIACATMRTPSPTR